MKKKLILVSIVCLSPACAWAEAVGGPVLAGAAYGEGPELGDISRITALEEVTGSMNISAEMLDRSQDRLVAWAGRDNDDEVQNVVPGGGGFAVSGSGYR